MAAVALGALCRIGFAWSHRQMWLPHAVLQEGYFEAGNALLSYRAFVGDELDQPKARHWRGPVYPVFVALAEAPFREPSPGHVYAAQVLVSVAAALLAGALAAWLAGPLAGFTAAAGMSFDPGQIAVVASLDVHGFYGILLLAAAAAAAFWAERPSAGNAALCSLALGTSLLCRSAHFPMPFLLGGAVSLWRRRGWCQGMLLLGLCLGWLLPYAARNGARFGRPDPFESHVSSYRLLAAAAGQEPTATITYVLALAESLEPGFRRRYEASEELERGRAVLALAWRVIRQDPLRYLLGIPKRLLNFWGPLLVFVALALVALPQCRLRHGLQAVFLTAASLTGYSAIFVQEEYRLAAIPLLWVLTGCGVAALAGGLQAAGQPPGLRAGLALFWGGIYAAFVAFLAAELLSPWTHPRLLPMERLPHRVLSLLERGVAVSQGRWDRAALMRRRLPPMPQERLEREMGRLKTRPPWLAAVADNPALACLDLPQEPDRPRVPLEYLDFCLSLYPHSPKLRQDRGVALYRLGRLQEAQVCLREAARLAPSDLEIALTLASVALARRDRLAARQALGRALALDLSAPEAPLRRQAVELRDALSR